MASNQMSNQKNKPGASHPGAPPLRRPSSDDGATERDYGSLGEVSERASDYWERGESQMRELVRDREGTAVLVALAAGVGVGLVIGSAFGRPHRQSQSWRDRMSAEGFGRRLMDRIESMIPDAVAEHFTKK